MLHFLLYIGLAYLVIGAIVYVWGHPVRSRAAKALAVRADAPEPKGKAGVLYRHLGHSAQAVNFLVNSATAVATAAVNAGRASEPTPIGALYEASIRRAFDVERLFITTGAPHSRALYPRNFAWFYPDLLSEHSIVSDADRERRTILLHRSLRTVLETMGARPYTTTIIPLSARRFAAVNYITPPSDSLLGVLTGIEQLLAAPASAARQCGESLLATYRADLERQLSHIAKGLTPITVGKKRYRIFDVRGNRSSATDTRRERLRFVVSANIWTTFAKAEQLGLMGGKVFAAFGLDKAQYKRDILALFGSEGYVKNSIDPAVVARASKPTDNITLDFAHTRNGFWDFSSPDERRLFAKTADLVFADPTFRDISANCYFVANHNPMCSVLHKYTTPSYHGRTVWSAFNTEFADRLIDLAVASGDDNYRTRAERILFQLKEYTERNGGYPELLDADGAPYRTWIYKSAVADSWFPRFASVWAKALGTMKV